MNVDPVYRELTEMYDPKIGTFRDVGCLKDPQEFSAAVSLADGKVLITGGQLIGGSGSLGSELFFPRLARFTFAGNMTTAATRTRQPCSTMVRS